MFKNLFCFPLGVQCTPIGLKRDPVSAALIGSAAIGAIGSMIGTSQSNTASASLNRETRDWQSKENAINRNWQEKMWNTQNEYNTPSAQKARLEAAGYNPFLDASTGVGTSSNAGSPGSPSNVSAPASPQMQPVPYGSIGSSLLQAVGLQADVTNRKSQAILNFAKSIPDLKKGGFSDDAIKDLAMSTIGSSPSDMAVINKLVGNEVSLSNAEVVKQSAEAEMAKLRESILRETGLKMSKTQINEMEQRIRESSQKVSLMISEENVNKESLKKIAAEAYNFIMQGQLAHANKLTVDQVRQAYISMIKAQALMYSSQADLNDANAMVAHNNWILGNYDVGMADYEWEKGTKVREFGSSPTGQRVQQAVRFVDYWFEKFGQATAGIKNVGQSGY